MKKLIFAATATALVMVPTLSASALYVKTGSLWAKGTAIPACFENPTKENEKLRQWVREGVEDEWEDSTGVTFSGWGACSAASKGIRITISDDCPGGSCSPHATVGQSDNLAHVTLLRTYARHWRAYQCAPGKISAEACAREYAVHEVGHALGFLHEMDRPETPKSCDSKGTPEANASLEGKYDDRSVMNYCATPRLGGGVLSKGDIDGARKHYGDSKGHKRSLARKAKKLWFHAQTKVNALWSLTGQKAKAALDEAKEHAKAIWNKTKAAFQKVFKK